jgi:hypothetical protein
MVNAGQCGDSSAGSDCRWGRTQYKGRDCCDLLCQNYRSSQFSIARIANPKLPNHPPQPIRFAAFDHLDRCRTFESRVRRIEPRTNLGSRHNLRERLEKPEHLRDVPLICRFGGLPTSHVAKVLLEAPTRRVKVCFTSRQNCADCLRPSSTPLRWSCRCNSGEAPRRGL